MHHTRSIWFIWKKIPHEEYGDKIKNAGLQETELGRRWFAAAEQSINSPLLVSIPYSEKGYFPAEEPKAAGIAFNAKRGERLTISVSKKPVAGFALYLDLWRYVSGEKPSLLLAADTSATSINYDTDKDGKYIVRLQPELLKGGEYTFTINAGPSLAFPVTGKVKSSIGSLWGDNRDEGIRKHEGIDIFAPKRTLLVAAATGVVTRTGENALGGKVVFLAPENTDYTVYYAHLDEQLVEPGQRVNVGDTIGLMGNTGNAKTTSPHLHFGIYTNIGAVDPLPFVNRTAKSPEKISASLANINAWVRNNKPVTLVHAAAEEIGPPPALDLNTLLKVEAVSGNWYKVSLPSGEKGFIASSNVTGISTPVRQATIKSNVPLLDAPAAFAAAKTTFTSGSHVSILAAFKEYYFVKGENKMGWMLKKDL